MKSFLYSLLAAVALTACTSPEKVLSFGKTTDHTYSNDFFGLSLNFDPNWSVKTQQELLEISGMGNEIIAENNPDLGKAIESAQGGTAYLFGVSEFELDGEAEFNPSVLVMAEKLSGLAGVMSGEAYIKHAMQMMEKSGIDITFGDINETNGFSSTESVTNYGGIGVEQTIMAYTTSGYALVLVGSYVGEENKQGVMRILESVKIK